MRKVLKSHSSSQGDVSCETASREAGILHGMPGFPLPMRSSRGVEHFSDTRMHRLVSNTHNQYQTAIVHIIIYDPAWRAIIVPSSGHFQSPAVEPDASANARWSRSIGTPGSAWEARLTWRHSESDRRSTRTKARAREVGLREDEHLDSTDRIVGLISKGQVLKSAPPLRFTATLIIGHRCGIFGSCRGLAGRQHDQRQRCTTKWRPLWKS